MMLTPPVRLCPLAYVGMLKVKHRKTIFKKFKVGLLAPSLKWLF